MPSIFKNNLRSCQDRHAHALCGIPAVLILSAAGCAPGAAAESAAAGAVRTVSFRRARCLGGCGGGNNRAALSSDPAPTSSLKSGLRIDRPQILAQEAHIDHHWWSRHANHSDPPDCCASSHGPAAVTSSGYTKATTSRSWSAKTFDEIETVLPPQLPDQLAPGCRRPSPLRATKRALFAIYRSSARKSLHGSAPSYLLTITCIQVTADQRTFLLHRQTATTRALSGCKSAALSPSRGPCPDPEPSRRIATEHAP